MSQKISSYQFESMFARYKARFGSTFSYYLVVRSPDQNFITQVYDLMQQALDGKISPITDKFLELELPPDVLS